MNTMTFSQSSVGKSSWYLSKNNLKTDNDIQYIYCPISHEVKAKMKFGQLIEYN